jgi:hypothetical protein
MLDNSKLIRAFCPDKDDGDTFIYTEMLDRGQRKGNNGQRLLKTFYHRSREEFDNQFETIKKLCDMSQVRAMTRLAPRSYKKVAGTFLRLVTETYITQNYAGMKTLYNRACGTTTPTTKLWLVDCDSPDEYKLASTFEDKAKSLGGVWFSIPSKKGTHIICSPFDMRLWPFPNIGIHKDNPTNLYIPDGAD